MGYKTQTPKEAYFHVQKDRVKLIQRLALYLGVDLQGRQPWDQDDRHPHQYARPHPFRDRIIYPDVAKVTQRTLPDSKINILDEKADYAVVQDCFNGTIIDSTLDFDVSYMKQIKVEEKTEKRSVVGWSFEEATQAGVEESGVSFSETVTVGAHGEEDKLRSLAKGDDDAVTSHIGVKVPYQKTYRVQQWENKSRMEVVSQELYFFDIAFECYSHKNLYHHRIAGDALKDNKREKRYPGTKGSFSMLTVHSEDDLHEILTGVSDDYPHQRRNLLENPHIKDAFEALVDKDKWSFEIETKTPFDKGISGHIQVIDLANKEVLKTEH